MVERTMDGRDDESHQSELALDEEEMRALGYAAVDLVVKRWADLRDGTAWVGATREEMEARFREDAPEEGSPPLEVMKRAADEVLHYAGRIDHPRFFAFVPSSPTWPTVMAELLATGFTSSFLEKFSRRIDCLSSESNQHCRGWSLLFGIRVVDFKLSQHVCDGFEREFFTFLGRYRIAVEDLKNSGRHRFR